MNKIRIKIWKECDIFLLTLVLIVFYFICEKYYPTLHYHLTGEDTFGENLQVCFYLGTSILFFISSRKLSSNRWISASNFNYLGMSFLMFFFAGEEISWGSRVFDYTIPVIVQNNHQEEVNLHNILPLYGNVSIYIYFSIIFGYVGPLLEYLFSKYTKIYRPIFLNFGFFLSYTVLIGFYVFLDQQSYVYFYEYTELVIAWTFFRIARNNSFLKNIKLNFIEIFCIIFSVLISLS